jgi:hypothetical protein
LVVSALVTVVFLAAGSAFSGAGPHIPWANWQFLDSGLLGTQPFQSLLCLHAQPPMLNGLAALVLWLERALGVGEPTVCWFFLAAFGLLGCFSAERLLAALNVSGLWRGFLLVGFFLSPSCLLVATEVYYTLFAMALLLAAAWAFHAFLLKGTAGRFALLALPVLGLVWMRTSYPPVWGCALLVAAALVKASPTGARRWGRLAVLVLAIAAAWAWPLKNLVFLGRFTNSSWEAINLTRGTDLPLPGLAEFQVAGVVPPATAPAPYGAPCNRAAALMDIDRPSLIADVARARADGRPRPEWRWADLTQPEQIVHLRNYNNVIFLDSWRDQVRKGVMWRIHHADSWVHTAGFFYRVATQPGFVHPYDLGLMLPGTPGGLGALYATTVRRVLFRPVVDFDGPRDSFGPGISEAQRHGFSSLTLFGVLLPLLLAAALIVAVRRRFDRTGWLLIFIVVLIGTNYGIPLLTDGREANRMTFESSGLLMVLLGWAGACLVRWARVFKDVIG